MNFKGKIITVIKNPGKLIEWLLRNPATGCFVSDKIAISILYRLRFHKKMNWDNPQTLNEKLLWLTVYDRRLIYNTLVDKYEAKQWMYQKLIGGGGIERIV